MITIYSTQNCIFCKKAKEFFNNNNIDFTEVNIESDEKTLQDFVAKTGQKSVPVIEIGSEMIVGFDENRLKQKFHLGVQTAVMPSDPAEENLCDSCQ